VPTPKAKKFKGSKLPKHLSGPQALAYFAAKKKEKDDAEEAKQARILARQNKKEEKELEKVNKMKMRKEKAEMKKKKGKHCEKNRRGQKGKRILEKVSESDSIDSDKDIVYMESDEEMLYSEIDKSKCPKCGVGDKQDDGWVGCEACPRWWHIQCSGDPDIVYYLDELENYPFTCLYRTVKCK
jgi:hypothetical protein